MAVNERVVYDSGDIRHEQLSPAQANRTEWYPGKAVSRPGDMNWERDSRIPTGTPAFGGEILGPVKMVRERVVKLGRNIVSDQTVLSPIVTGTRVETRHEEGVSGTDTVTDTLQPSNLSVRERKTGFDNIEGV